VTLDNRLAAALADRYRLERELGQGGMATVYLAEDLKHHRKVAVKVLRPDLAATMGPERFAREIEVAARLQHPHILGLLDSGDAEGFFYYVMPYVEGETLRDRLARSGELPVPEALRLLGEIAEALAVAHHDGVVHRDIKPENILLAGRHALVMDFGVAKAVTEATGRQQLTTAGVALGTPAYMAPEQATADPQLDHRVDIYALGVLAYEMLTGQPPFHGLAPQQTLAAHVTQAPLPVSQRRPGLSPAIEGLVMKCLAKRPADRYQTADEVVAALEPLATPSGGITPTHTMPVSAVRPPRGIPRWAAWAAGGAVVAGGALAMSLWQHRPATITIGKRVAVAVAPELELHPSLSPDGKVLAYTIVHQGTADLYLQQVDGGSPVPLTTQMPGPQAFGVLSPDGARLLFHSDRGIEVMPALGGQARVVVPKGRNPIGWGNWAPDGERIVHPEGETLFVQRLDSGGRTAIAHGRELHSPAWSGDGSWIAYVEGNPGFHINGNLASSALWVVRASGGAPVRIAEANSFNTSPVWVPGSRALLFVSDRDGGRDIYQVSLKGNGAPSAPPVRITTGLDAEWVTLSANGKRMAWSEYTETSNIWSLEIPARDSVPASQATQVTTGTQDIEAVAVSPDGSWLYYDSDRSGNADIWRQPLRGGGAPEQLTTDPAGDFNPTVSRDGKWVAFHSLRTGNRDLFVIPAAGGRAVQVTTSLQQDRNPDWFPGDTALVWDEQSNPDSSLWTASRRPDGSWGAAHPLPFGGGAAVVRLSPDGRWVTYSTAGGGLEAFAPATRERRLLTNESGRFWPAWSPDGRVVYYGFSDSLGRFTIGAAPLAGGAPRVLVYANDPTAQAYRYGLAVQGGRLYFPLMSRKADVWVAEVKPGEK
jgi:serine/threonine-protein kinase